jgi:hypothetical protein
MRPKGRFRPSFTNVLVTIALFASLGGTSYAAIKVTGKNIKNNTVKSVDVKNHTLKRSDLRKGLLESTQAAPLDSIAYQADRAEGPTGVPAGSDYTVIATLNVAPGAYTVFAKVDLQADELAASHCQLQAGGKSDVSARVQDERRQLERDRREDPRGQGRHRDRLSRLAASVAG